MEQGEMKSYGKISTMSKPKPIKTYGNLSEKWEYKNGESKNLHKQTQLMHMISSGK